MNSDVNDMLLSAWLRVSAGVRNERLVQSMTFNEVFTCGILYKYDGEEITASDICEETGMLKSQVNRVLVGLEEAGIIVRARSKTDKRKTLLRLTQAGKEKYISEHESVLKIFDRLGELLGSVKIIQAANILNELADAMEKIKEEEH